MKYKIMMVEDDPDIAELVSLHLEKYGFAVRLCGDFSNVVGEFEQFKPHLVLLDINLPAYDGFYWCGKIREKSSCPIIFLSSRNADSDQVYAMMNGGDDYVTKPFSLEVITAKITAILRRAYGEYGASAAADLRCGDCVFSQSRLTRIMFQNYPDVVSRADLLGEIWDDESFVEENTLNVAISRVRKRLESIGSTLVVKPVRGVGYRMGDAGHE